MVLYQIFAIIYLLHISILSVTDSAIPIILIAAHILCY
jgi:hypothetical protein